MNQNQSDVLSVSQYLDRVNLRLKSEKSRVLGEVVGLQEYPGRSYLYFSLKDKADQSTVKCFMWKNDYRLSGIKLSDGLEVVATAYPAVYKPNGGLSLQVEAVELIGEGALKIAYEELKKKLEQEGLFSEEKKRPLPEYPHKIGVITSKSGAVINDFLANIGPHGFEINFVDSKVEGAEAIKDLLSAIEILRHKNIDVLVVMRGGGSLESFLAFNNEALVRALAEFPVPVITGIGHDKDVPLVSFVSDKNVSTPTAVAHLVSLGWDEAVSHVRLYESKILAGFESTVRDVHYKIGQSETGLEKKFMALFEFFRKAEASMSKAVEKIGSNIFRMSEKTERLSKDLVRGFELLSKTVAGYLVQSEKNINLSSPENQLKKGYSIVKSGGKVVRSVSDTSPGQELDITLCDGTIKTQIL